MTFPRTKWPDKWAGGAIVNAFLTHEGIDRMDWPACSADLSPIENLWSCLKREIDNDVTLQTTLREIPAIALRHWAAIPQVRITTLMNSMRKRCQAVINANGVIFAISLVSFCLLIKMVNNILLIFIKKMGGGYLILDQSITILNP